MFQTSGAGELVAQTSVCDFLSGHQSVPLSCGYSSSPLPSSHCATIS